MYQVSKEYLTLFNAMTDIDKALCELHRKIVFAQELAEELYMSGNDTDTGNEDCRELA